jgi:hypothetical protein
MSLLPQRKKSPEEIAKLREDLGIPAAPPAADPPSTPDPPATPHAIQVIEHHHPPAEAPPSNHPPAAAPHPAPKQVHSFKRSERITAVAPAEPATAAPVTDDMAPVVLSLKPVRSLRKSEQAPLSVMTPPARPADSALPGHRHSDQEIQEIRRREALALRASSVVNPKLIAAHPALFIPGYLAALAGAVCFACYQLPLAATASCAATALLIAGYISLKKPLSLHHAAFIAVITLIVIVFGALHYFPQLRHGT